jgi:hypothetical protein
MSADIVRVRSQTYWSKTSEYLDWLELALQIGSIPRLLAILKWATVIFEIFSLLRFLYRLPIMPFTFANVINETVEIVDSHKFFLDII